MLHIYCLWYLVFFQALMACFQLNLSLLTIIHADYLRRRGDIRQLALCLSKLKPLKRLVHPTAKTCFFAFPKKGIRVDG